MTEYPEANSNVNLMEWYGIYPDIDSRPTGFCEFESHVDKVTNEFGFEVLCLQSNETEVDLQGWYAVIPGYLTETTPVAYFRNEEHTKGLLGLWPGFGYVKKVGL
jgi:hypothetical protein